MRYAGPARASDCCGSCLQYISDSNVCQKTLARSFSVSFLRSVHAATICILFICLIAIAHFCVSHRCNIKSSNSAWKLRQRSADTSSRRKLAWRIGTALMCAKEEENQKKVGWLECNTNGLIDKAKGLHACCQRCLFLMLSKFHRSFFG